MAEGTGGCWSVMDVHYMCVCVYFCICTSVSYVLYASISFSNRPV